jgi:hypothetical protein
VRTEWDVQLLTVAVTAAVSVATTLVAVLSGPAWKDRVDTRRVSRQRSEHLLARYFEPLAWAAFDLQSRLYNIYRQQLMTASRISEPYRRFSTLWFYGQFLAWIEIVRREVQVIDVGDVRRTARLQRHLFDVLDIMATDGIADASFRVFRADQRAIGEAVVTERSTGEHRRSDSTATRAALRGPPGVRPMVLRASSTSLTLLIRIGSASRTPTREVGCPPRRASSIGSGADHRRRPRGSGSRAIRFPSSAAGSVPAPAPDHGSVPALRSQGC